MSVSKAQVLEALRRVKGPDLQSNIVELGLVSEVLIKDGRVYFSITVPSEKAAELEPLRQAAQKVVEEIDGVSGATAVLTAEAPRGTASAGKANGGPSEHARVSEARARGATGDGGAVRSRAAAGVPGVKHLVAVASGKGGVGKSTTAVNLALGFIANGLKAGVLDADIYGPSQPRLLGLSGQPSPMPNSNMLRPMEAYGLKAMSMGFLVDEGTPVVWRGPMLVSALNQMLRDVAWNIDGDLDVLVIDMPPGTGDVQLSMAQQVPLSGAVIVSTPQDLALIDARKGLNMFRKVDVPVLGIIENMSYFICTKCGERHEIFGHGGAKNEADKLGLPFLGGIPLDINIRTRSDAGQPITATEPGSVHAQTFRELAARVWGEVEASKGTAAAPKLEVSPDKAHLKVGFADGRDYDLSAEMLRVMSPSAEVQGHSPDQRVTVGGKRNVKISAIEPVGNYAAKIIFDDGHSTGLFAWTYLDALGREKNERWAAYEAELAKKGLNRG
ncbi:MAG: P-loop NTPase [Hyphomicrobiaceae bacterium]|nr:P-loop NTPase [Hyphomicrobiaceae bacterium]MCC0007625.1 P-loop NTPase [Hyphomicrobiaceae bacterium]